MQVPANAPFLTEGSHDVVVEWRRGKELVASSTTTIMVDLTAPSVSYTAPTSLSVGTAVSIAPTTTDEDIASYALTAGSSLPSGLALDGTSGVVSGTPSAAATAGAVTIVVTGARTRLVEKKRTGRNVTRRYDEPRTPYKRLLESWRLERNAEQALKRRVAQTNPAALQRTREELRDRVWGMRRRGG